MDEPEPAPGEPRPAPAAVLEVVGPLLPEDVPRLCARARRWLRALPPEVAVECDVGRLGPPDLRAVDALARLQLLARRRGHEVRLRNATPDLRTLLRSAGLCDVVPLVEDATSRRGGRPGTASAGDDRGTRGRTGG